MDAMTSIWEIVASATGCFVTEWTLRGTSPPLRKPLAKQTSPQGPRPKVREAWRRPTRQPEAGETLVLSHVVATAGAIDPHPHHRTRPRIAEALRRRRPVGRPGGQLRRGRASALAGARSLRGLRAPLRDDPRKRQ